MSGPLSLLLLFSAVSLLLMTLPSVSTVSSVVAGPGRLVDEESGAASVVSDAEVAFCEALVGADDDDDAEVSPVGFASADSALGVSLGVALVGLAVVTVLEVSSSAEGS